MLPAFSYPLTFSTLIPPYKSQHGAKSGLCVWNTPIRQVGKLSNTSWMKRKTNYFKLQFVQDISFNFSLSTH
jgi:hypothetical protein